MHVSILRGMFIAAVASIALLGSSNISRADDVGTYDLENVTFDAGGTATGSFSYDFTTNTSTAIDLSTQDLPGVADQTFALSGPNGLVPGDFGYPTGFCPSCNTGGPAAFDQFTINNGTDELWLALSLPAMTQGTNPLVPDLLYADGQPVNVYSDFGYNCTNSQAGDGPGCYSVDAIAAGGSLDASIVSTPEPSSSLLLLIGCGALLGFAWRRRAVMRSTVEAN